MFASRGNHTRSTAYTTFLGSTVMCYTYDNWSLVHESRDALVSILSESTRRMLTEIPISDDRQWRSWICSPCRPAGRYPANILHEVSWGAVQHVRPRRLLMNVRLSDTSTYSNTTAYRKSQSMVNKILIYTVNTGAITGCVVATVLAEIPSDSAQLAPPLSSLSCS